MKTQRGTILVLVAMVLTALCGVGTLAVDATYLMEVRSELQNTADAAALAAASGLPVSQEEARQRALAYTQLNPILQPPQPVELGASDILFGHWDPQQRRFFPGATPTDSVQVTARLGEGTRPAAPTLFFARLFGVRSAEMRALATAELARPGRDIAIGVDQSGQMDDDTQSGGPPQPLTDAKQDGAWVVEHLIDQSTGSARDQAALIYFHSTPEQVQLLTGELNRVHELLVPGPGTEGKGGVNLSAAMATLREELGSPRANPAALRFGFLISDGRTNRPVPTEKAEREVRKEAQLLRQAGIRIIAVTVGTNTNEPLMAEIAQITRGVHLVNPTQEQLQRLPDELEGPETNTRAQLVE